MKQKIKKFLISSGLIKVYRAIKYIINYLKYFPQNLFLKIKGAPDKFRIPPSFLIYLTINQPSIKKYLTGGRITANSIKKLLSKNNIEIDKFKTSDNSFNVTLFFFITHFL